jgi:hypothetical protein
MPAHSLCHDDLILGKTSPELFHSICLRDGKFRHMGPMRPRQAFAHYNLGMTGRAVALTDRMLLPYVLGLRNVCDAAGFRSKRFGRHRSHRPKHGGAKQPACCFSYAGAALVSAPAHHEPVASGTHAQRRQGWRRRLGVPSRPPSARSALVRLAPASRG